jgi:F0F1-type ATP synthase assembly protein I
MRQLDDRLQAQLDAALDRLAAAESERDDIAGMTLIVYLLFAAGAGLIGFGLGWFAAGW